MNSVRVLSTISVILSLGLAACKFSTANISEAAFAKTIADDKSPLERTLNFHRHHSELHCCVRMANIPSDTKVKAIWFYLPEGADRQSIDSAEVAVDTDAWVDFSLTPSGTGLPYGKYSVEVFLEGSLDRTMPFEIIPMFGDGPIRETVMASKVTSEYFPTELADAFPVSVGKIYAAVYVDQAPAGTTISAMWYQLEGETRQDIGTQDYPCNGDGWIGFYLKPNNVLSQGQYHVDILHDGVLHNTMSFTLN